jgi:hypothetical protein
MIHTAWRGICNDFAIHLTTAATVGPDLAPPLRRAFDFRLILLTIPSVK